MEIISTNYSVIPNAKQVYLKNIKPLGVKGLSNNEEINYCGNCGKASSVLCSLCDTALALPAAGCETAAQVDRTGLRDLRDGPREVLWPEGTRPASSPASGFLR